MVSAGLQQQDHAAWQLVGSIPDPEIPVLTLTDLGIIRWIRSDGDTTVVGVAPTYSGCPATEVIEASVLETLESAGYAAARVERVLSPPWTTDWISDEGRKKLAVYGIAPPDKAAESKRALFHSGQGIACPRCASIDTSRVSEFGSTPCKASWKCNSCLEPFEYFKCL
ncbi:MAG: phenylacetate-CoA oxygenase subunit PaaJ [Gammaproteobacteria bacterium]|nr:phenylacetate-CoA oxygenase subunit PaaJ [Gammaproteobacteria bacterium]